MTSTALSISRNLGFASSIKASLITPPKCPGASQAFCMHLSRLLQPAFAEQLLHPTDDV